MNGAAGDETTNRRPLTTRSNRWARAVAAALVRTRISPDQISLLSLVFAAVGSAALVWAPGTVGLVVCAGAIQLRLLCNMLDGMVAVEGGKGSAVGALYNEIPDRVADSMLIVALGYAVHLPVVGWLGALAAAVTAYIRVLGGSLGLPQDFRGPLAKPHRMAVMTAACLLGAIEQSAYGSMHTLVVAAYVVAIGSVATCVTRTHAIATRLRQARP
ncbi:MAG: CDP-alcohol phosphatidyltransferase family protein [Planctomycetes bacterium]|nr:CDP-alcohol phosphatidyltransferase family protein [Planctomycetota bacterium]MCC7170810.1 CDP-alcohol phosphatidyltransferase family protein [Planctomycetota bacterium]